MVLTGPGGSGKTTIAELLAQQYGYSSIDGDNLDTEFFPNGGQSLPENLDRLKLAHQKILQAAKDASLHGNNVVVDYIIFGDYMNFFEIFRREFGDKLEIKVLWPSEDVNINRDKTRECWTTGADRIRAVRNKLWSFRDCIGKGNYINTSELTPFEVVELLHASFTDKKP